MAKKAKGKKVILPTKMSALIKLALKDIRVMEKTKNVVVDMGTYFEPRAELICRTDNGVVVEKKTVCVVCAAGAVMANTLGANINGRNELSPTNFAGNERQLNAIDALRSGAVGGAAVALGLITNYYTPEYDKVAQLNTVIPDYEPLDPKPFHKAMEGFQKKLEKAGY